MTDRGPEKSPASILIVEDEIIFAESLAKSLERLGFQIAGIASTAGEAIRAAFDSMPNLILMDINLGGQLDGIEAYDRIRTQFDIPVVYLTAHAERDVLDRAKLTEPYGYLTKPITFHELRSTIETVLHKHEADRRVRRSEARLAKAEELAHLGSWEWDIYTGTLEWSDESFRAFGHDPRQTEPCWALFVNAVHPQDRELVGTAIKDALDAIKPFETEFRIVRPDGTERVLHSRADVIFDNQGRPTRMLGMALDITERKRAEDLIVAQRDLGMSLGAASNLEEALSMCLDTALHISEMEAAGIYVVNDDSSLELVAHSGLSETFLSMVSHVPGDLPETQLVATGSPAYFCGPFAEWAPSLTSAVEREGFRSAAVVPIVYQSRPILSLHLGSRTRDYVPGHIQRALETIAPQIGAAVTRIRAEDAVRKSHEILQAFINSTDDALALFDREKRFLVANRALASRFGKEIEDLIGHTLVDLLPPDLVAQREESVEEVFRSGASMRCQNSRAQRHFDSMVNPVLGGDGQVHSVAVFSRDITEQKRTQAALNEAKDLAEAASRAKSQFLAIMSHELRTPLNAIIGFSEMLQDQLFGKLNETQLSHVNHIVESGHHLIEIINEILDLSRIESGGMRLELSQFDVAQMLEHSLAIVRETARKKSIELLTQLDPGIEGIIIEADEVRLRQVVLNLLSNAVKFTPERGSIHIHAYKTADEIIISVTDNGIGIDPLDQERIFNAFEQVDTSISRRQQGTGLGLSLARTLTEMHGGRIWVESQGLGKGSTFILAVPVR